MAAIGGAKLGTVNGTNNIWVDVEACELVVFGLIVLFLLLQLQAATTTWVGCARFIVVWFCSILGCWLRSRTVGWDIVWGIVWVIGCVIVGAIGCTGMWTVGDCCWVVG